MAKSKRPDIFIPEGTHAKMSASGASRWLACPGSVYLSKGMPNNGNAAASQGTLAHHVASECLEKGFTPDQFLKQNAIIDGFEVVVDAEMVEKIGEYTEYVKSQMVEGDILYIEVDLTPELIKHHPDFGGMADAIIYSPSRELLIVIDLKYGKGVEVTAEDNIQLKYYGTGAMLKINKPVQDIKVCIFQPRISDPRPKEDTFEAFDLVDFLGDLVKGAELALSEPTPDVILNTGSHCTFCPAKVKCPEMKTNQDLIMTKEFEVVQDGVTITPERLAEALEIAPMVEARIKALRALAYDLALKGAPPTGYKLVNKRATRKWTDEDEVIAYLDMLTVSDDDIYTPQELRSPAQIEKLLDKDEKKMMSSFVEKKSSGMKLVPESDKAPAATLASPEDFDILN